MDLFTRSGLSDEQSDIVSFSELKKNLKIGACAGSGKSYTMEAIARTNQKKYKSQILMCFSRAVRNRADEKMGDIRNLRIANTHSFGYQLIRGYNKGKAPEKNEMKYFIIARQYCEKILATKGAKASAISFKISAIIEKLHMCLTDYTSQREVRSVADRFDLDYDDAVLAAIKPVFEAGLRDTLSISFSDMIAMPYYLNFKIHKYEHVLSDEYQDYNAAQWWMVTQAMSGVATFVGDENQGIYGFMGAMDSIDEITKMLNPEEKTLSVTYRCSESVVKYARNFVPSINPKQGAKRGFTSTVDSVDIFDFRPSDMVLCARNAPLVKACVELTKARVPCHLTKKGMDLRMKSCISDIEAASDGYSMFDEGMSKWLEKRLEKAGKSFIAARDARDTYQCVDAVARGYGCTSFDELKKRTINMFDAQGGIPLYTVHGSKGLEVSDEGTVYILSNKDMETDDTTDDDTKEEMRKLRYVATTRAKNGLVIEDCER